MMTLIHMDDAFRHARIAGTRDAISEAMKVAIRGGMALASTVPDIGDNQDRMADLIIGALLRIDDERIREHNDGVKEFMG